MSGKDKIEKDYETFSAEIERLSEEETRKIREKIDAIKAEADKTGEDVESSLEKREAQEAKKKG
jgi:hypothetical protein